MASTNPEPSFRRLAGMALLLALLVVSLGAYVRLSDAGLGCPDWPGCYGRMVVPESTTLYPERPLVAHKAWKEMAHRYAAGALGLLILGLFVSSWRHAPLRWARPLATVLLGLVIFQALLGMWTVTLKLHPLVVMGHLLGGLGVTALLFALLLGPVPVRPQAAGSGRVLARMALLAIVAQITLGGWTSANYAAPSCPDFPRCQGRWWPEMAFAEALSPPPPITGDYEGGTLTAASRTAIHFTHRLGALVVLATVALLLWRLRLSGGAPFRWGMLLGALAAAQFALGVANIWLHFPLGVAVAHNAGAALLLLCAVGLNLRLGVPRRSPAGGLLSEAHDVVGNH